MQVFKSFTYIVGLILNFYISKVVDINDGNINTIGANEMSTNKGLVGDIWGLLSKLE